MAGRRGAFVRNLVVPAALAACAAFGWASGGHDTGPGTEPKKVFDVVSTLTTQFTQDGLTVTATCASKYTTLWLGLAAYTKGSISLPGETQSADPIASIQVYRFLPDSSSPKPQEETSFKDGLSIIIESKGKSCDRLLLYVPRHASEPAHRMIVTPDMAGKGKITADGFTVSVDTFKPNLIRITLFEWPAGDPIMYDW